MTHFVLPSYFDLFRPSSPINYGPWSMDCTWPLLWPAIGHGRNWSFHFRNNTKEFRHEDKNLSGKKDIADWFLVKIDDIEIAGSKCRNGTFSESKDKNFDFEFRAEFDNGCSTQSAENGKLIQSYHFAGDNSIVGAPIVTSRKLSFAFR